MRAIGWAIMLPFRIAWFLFKILATIVLLFLGPFGWAFIVGWWTAGQITKPRPVYLVDKNGNRVEYKVE